MPKALCRVSDPFYRDRVATTKPPIRASGSHGARPMIKRAFGSTGLAVSALGLGCNNFGVRLDLEKTKAVVDAAIEAGVNFIDTADAYGNFGGSETFLGAALGSR